MMDNWLAVVLSSGAFLTGLGALIKVFLDSKNAKEASKNAKETTTINHSSVVFEGYGELLDRVQIELANTHERVNVMSATIERQGNEIQSLRLELRDRDDKIRMLTLDRDDLVALVTSSRPNLRTL